ncbi:MAG: manganese efflux pump MntP family protein [Coriobacteriales bacterium]|jgi:putative Mn2+ efflux pump MntP|nr:manganese efflux pump MntP family protein [Coriobacteriales bacterium]
MLIIEIIILGLILSLDALAITITNLMVYPGLSRTRSLMLPLTFGLFQGAMILVGYFIGSLALSYVKAFAGPIGLAILAVIGARMIFDAVKDIRKDKKKKELGSELVENTELLEPETKLRTTTILLEGVASSLDALIVGVSLVALGFNIYMTSTIVGITTFLVCLVGLFIGKRLGVILVEKAQIVGGIALILIGINICFF